MKREKEDTLSELKLGHKQAMRQQAKLHAEAIEKKKQQLKKADHLVVGMREMFSEMLDEMAVNKKQTRMADKAAKELKERAARYDEEIKHWTGVSNGLTDDILDEQQVRAELQEKVDEYERVIDVMQADFEEQRAEQETHYESVIQYMDHYYEDVVEKMSPRYIKKHWVKNKKSGELSSFIMIFANLYSTNHTMLSVSICKLINAGAHAEWLPHVDKLILEMHANKTPPSCIQSNIYAMSRALYPDLDVVLELPSLKHIKNMRTALAICTKILAAHQIGNAKELKQLHTDETSRRQASIINVVLGILNENDELKSICLTGSIISEDGTAENQSKEIIASFAESGRLLDEWRVETKAMFPEEPELLEQIPTGEALHPSRLCGGTLEHDTCNTALSTGDKLGALILEKGTEKGLSKKDLVIYQGECFHHLRNVWLGAVEKYLSKRLEEHMKEDLALIPYHLRVTCKLSELNRQVDKECNVTCNYPKGHGDEYCDWKNEFHPGKRWLPVIRSLGGNRQDVAFEAALPIYDQRQDILNFLAGELEISENILQDSLFIAIASMQVIAMLRVASIMHLAIVLPVRWLASNTHKLAHHGWGERSMGVVVDLLHAAMSKVQSDGSLLLDYDFIMNIFSPLYEKLPEFKVYLDYHLEEKEGNVIGSSKPKDRVLAIDEALFEVFWPTLDSNRETTEFCIELASGIGTTMIMELEDTKKATHKYLSAKDGIKSQKLLSEEEKEASLGVRATNDPSESGFATMTQVLSDFGRIDLFSACGLGQTRYNGDMRRDLSRLVSGRKGKKKDTKVEVGIFHRLDEKLQDSLLRLCKKKAAKARKDFQRSLKRQREVKRKKKKIAQEKKLEAAQKDFITASYFWQQYDSPRCWKTAEEAMDNFENLKTKKDKFKYVKEQILIRYLGLAWKEAYHPWSKGGKTYQPSELLEHLINNVIPINRTPPAEPPVTLPRRKDHGTIGDDSADLIALDNNKTAREQRIRLNGMKERERLEDIGFGDELMEMQEATPPIDKLRKGLFKIDMCFEYTEEGETILQWCQGIAKFLKEDKYYIVIEVKWNDEFVQNGQRKTKEKVLKSAWNPETHKDRAWRENLHHLTMSAERI